MESFREKRPDIAQRIRGSRQQSDKLPEWKHDTPLHDQMSTLGTIRSKAKQFSASLLIEFTADSLYTLISAKMNLSNPPIYR